MCVYYSVYHVHDVCIMLNIDNEIIINSRSIILLNEARKDWITRKVKMMIIVMLNENCDKFQRDKYQDELKRVRVYRRMCQL
jgi:hypothetical protein